MSVRSGLYRLARLLGDANAIRRGPGAVMRRMKRRALGRLAGKIIAKIVPAKRR